MPMQYDPIPSTYEDAKWQIIKGLTKEELEFIRSQPTAAICHMPFMIAQPPDTWNISGMAIRNAWNLWGAQEDRPTALREEFISRFKLGHADDMSGMLLDEAWADVKSEPFSREEQILRYHNHWLRMGIDPVTQEEI